MLRSSDSHCSAEEEHTEGLPSLGDSPVSSSYSELQQVILGHCNVITTQLKLLLQDLTPYCTSAQQFDSVEYCLSKNCRLTSWQPTNKEQRSANNNNNKANKGKTIRTDSMSQSSHPRCRFGSTHCQSFTELLTVSHVTYSVVQF